MPKPLYKPFFFSNNIIFLKVIATIPPPPTRGYSLSPSWEKKKKRKRGNLLKRQELCPYRHHTGGENHSYFTPQHFVLKFFNKKYRNTSQLCGRGKTGVHADDCLFGFVCNSLAELGAGWNVVDEAEHLST